MRVNINLATQPYQDIRKFYTSWIAVLLALLLVTGGMVYVAVHSWQNSHTVSRLISAERDKLAKLDEQQKQDEAILDRPENRDVREQGQFINELIRRKAISWTKIFSDLEKMMPPRLHVIAMAPEISEEGGIAIRMQLGGDSRQRAYDLVRKMEESSTFRYPQVVSENAQRVNETKEDPLQFEITAQYVPQLPRSGQ